MRATYNFGQVIDSYIANVFPNTPPKDATDAAEETSKPSPERDKGLGLHFLLQCLELCLIIAVLILLCTYVLHVRSAYTATTTLGHALKTPVAFSESGFKRVLRALHSLDNESTPGYTQFKKDDVTYRSIEVKLTKSSHVLPYSKIRSKKDVAFWLQFGLIPSMFNGLNSYNKLVGNTVRLSFRRSNYKDLTYDVNKRTIIPNVTIRHQLMLAALPVQLDDDDDHDDDDDDDNSDQPVVSGVIENDDGVDIVKLNAPDAAKKGEGTGDAENKNKDDFETLLVKLPYAGDGKYHTFSGHGGNFQYITGDSVDAALTSLNMGTSYSRTSPYFPLAAVITDDSTSSVTLEAFMSNPINYTISYVSVTFKFGRGADGNDNYIVKKTKASSISSYKGGQTRLISVLIYMALLLLSIGHCVHSYYLHRRHKPYSLTILYIIDIASKICLLLCIFAYGIRLFWSYGKLPQIHSVTYADGRYDAVVGLSKNGRIIDSDLLQTVFNNLRKNIQRGYWTVGFFHVVTFTTIALLFMLVCTILCRGRKVDVMLRYFAFHSLLQFVFAVIAMLMALCMVSLVNAYIVNFIRAADSSFQYNFATLSNILAGVLNKQVESYLKNYTALHTISIVILVVLFSYTGIFVLITMMFSIKPQGNLESFESQPLKDQYDNSRLIRVQLSLLHILRHVLPSYNVTFLRQFAFSRNRQDQAVPHGNSDGVSSQHVPTSTTGHNITMPSHFHDKSLNRTHFVQRGNMDISIPPKRSFYIWRMLSYSLIVLGVVIFGFKDHGYHSVRRLLQHTINGKLQTDALRLPFYVKEFTTEDVDNAVADPPSSNEDKSSDGKDAGSEKPDTEKNPGEDGDAELPKVEAASSQPNVAEVQGNNEDVKMKKVVSVKLVLPQVSFAPRSINNRQELFHWLTKGNINKMFEWNAFDNDYIRVEGSDGNYLSLYNRYFLVPSIGSILFRLKLRTNEGFKLPLFEKMNCDFDAHEVRSLLNSSQGTVGIDKIFGDDVVDFPDVVENVALDILLVDSKTQNKLYRGILSFCIRKSGIVLPYVKVRSILGVHLSSSYINWFFPCVSIVSLLVFIALSTWFGMDCYRFVIGYNYRYRITSRRHYWRGVAVFFLNDYFHFVDVLIILLIGSICIFYLVIHANTNVVYDNVKALHTLDARLDVNAALTNVRFYHKSMWAALSVLIFMILLREVSLFQRMIAMVYTCMKSALALYFLVLVAMILIISTFLIFIFVFASEHFNEFSRGEGSLLKTVRLLFNETYMRDHLYESRYLAMLIYPACMVLKLWILNLILAYIWAIWPKNEKDADSEAIENTQQMFSMESVEPYELSHDTAHLTGIADDQLDLIPGDVKAHCADEALWLNESFKEYNRKYTESGMTPIEYTEWLHTKLVAEMHEIQSKCENMQLKLEMVSKQCDIMENKVDRNLEVNISLLEVALSDKKDELASTFETYKRLLNEKREE